MEKLGRQIEIGPTDNTSNERTPRNRLNLIPENARGSFAPYAPQNYGINPAEADMTRIAPGRHRHLKPTFLPQTTFAPPPPASG